MQFVTMIYYRQNILFKSKPQLTKINMKGISKKKEDFFFSSDDSRT